MKRIAFYIGAIMLLSGIALDRHQSWVLSLTYLVFILVGLVIVSMFWEDK